MNTKNNRIRKNSLEQIAWVAYLPDWNADVGLGYPKNGTEAYYANIRAGIEKLAKKNMALVRGK